MRTRKTLEGYHLYDAGISYHTTGYVTNGKKRTHFAFLADTVTEAQKDALRAICPLVEFRTSSPEYAPEMKRVAILYPVNR